MFKKIILDNGVRIISVPAKQTKAITLLVLFKTGSRYEEKSLNGISHFLEHMVFKGTKKRPDSLAISHELDSVGADYNAFTDLDHTGYYIKIEQGKINLAVDILYDMLFHSKFEDREIKREKGVILEEINMYHDNPLMYLENLFYFSLYQGNSLGWEIAGSKETVKKIKAQDIINYRNHYYIPSRTVIGISGKIDQKTLFLLKKYFSKIKPSSRQLKEFEPFKEEIQKPRLKLRYQETEQVQLGVGFPAYSRSHERIYPLSLLNVILGGNMSSRLFLSVREKRGLAYFIHSTINTYEDTGNLFIQAGLDKSRIEEAIYIILQELKRIKKGVRAEELKRAYDFIKGKTALALEDSASLSSWYGKQELLMDKILTPEEKLKKLSKVTRSDIEETAQEIISFKKLNLAVIGPYKEEKFLKFL